MIRTNHFSEYYFPPSPPPSGRACTGVGKTAIAEGLALRIAEGRVPRDLQTKRVWSLDMGALIAGTRPGAEGAAPRCGTGNSIPRPTHRVSLPAMGSA